MTMNSDSVAYAFHEAFGFPIGVDLRKQGSADEDEKLKSIATVLQVLSRSCRSALTEAPDDVRIQRVALIVEELHEMVVALAQRDVVQSADGMADLRYVVDGTFVAFGLPIHGLMLEVHVSNMSKTPGEFKPIKGEGFKLPAIVEVLRANGVKL